MTNGFHPEKQEAQQAAFVAHVKAELSRLGMSPLALADALGIEGEPGRLVLRTDREGLRA